MNDEQLKAIRERAAEAHSWVYFDIGTETDANTLVDAFATVHTDLISALEHVDAQAERIQKLESALCEIAEFDPGEGDAMAFALMAGFARGRAHRALSDWTPFADIVAGVDEDTAHGG
jgi:hypothetical protein